MNNFMNKDLVRKDRIPRDWHEQFPLPPFLTKDRGSIRAKCPKCNRITSVRVCYGCKELMCQDCLIEHQIECLHKPSPQEGKGE